MHCTNLSPSSHLAAYEAGSKRRRRQLCSGRYRTNPLPFARSSTRLRDGRSAKIVLGRRIPWPCVLPRALLQRQLGPGRAVSRAMLALHRDPRKSGPRGIAIQHPHRFAQARSSSVGRAVRADRRQAELRASYPGVGTGRGGYAIFVSVLSRGEGPIHAWPLGLLLAARGFTCPLRIWRWSLGEPSTAAAGHSTFQCSVGVSRGDVLVSYSSEAACLVMPSIGTIPSPHDPLEAFARLAG